MTSLKKLAIVTLCFGIVASAVASLENKEKHIIKPRSVQSHNIVIGKREQNDRLAYEENIEKSSKLFQVVELEKTFYTKDEIITQIVAIDKKTNGNGASAKIVQNGIGHNNVTLKFVSQRNHGIKFVVQIFAKPRPISYLPPTMYPKLPAVVNKSHNFTLGHREKNDNMIHKENVKKFAISYGMVEINKTFNIGNNYVITEVKAIDTKSNGDGGYVNLVKNGPGHNNVTLGFKSQTNQGIEFIVEIYGKPKISYTPPKMPILSSQPIKSHNLTIGLREPYDQKVYQENIIQKSNIFKKVEFEKTFSTTFNNVITQVKAIDQNTKGDGAYATLVHS